MDSNGNRSFEDNKQVQGMKLPEYLEWATGNRKDEKPLKLPPIQRGFVWKPKQIVDLWDSLLRGMPIGSMMVTKLTGIGCDLTTKKTEEINNEAIGLLDGQQRTLAMMIGWPSDTDSPDTGSHCLWIDLAEDGYAGSPFKIRLTTMAQPFGFDHISHSRLSRYERKKAREHYDEKHNQKYETKPDYELFSLINKSERPRPWKADRKNDLFLRIKDLWQMFKINNNDEVKFSNSIKSEFKSTQDFPGMDERLSNLFEAFTRLESIEIPLILIPKYISSVPESKTLPSGAADSLTLLFERIGRNGSSLSADDLLFSMIKQQWPGAQDLVNNIHNKIEVKAFMNATDYVMTAFRLAAAQYNDCEDKHKIADTPRPNPGDFHRHLSNLLGKKEDEDKPLRNYLKKDNSLIKAFKELFDTLSYRGDIEQDIGLPLLMMPHLSRSLIQVLLRWIMLNSSNGNAVKANRQAIISFTLFWYLNIWYEEKASKKAFEIIGKKDQHGTFPASDLYKELIVASENEIGLALPLMSYERLKYILKREDSASFRSYDEIFNKHSDEFIANIAERELYKRFCWWRKPVLLWLQRAYVDKQFKLDSFEKFAGFTDEDTVPYDYDHLCPQKHWGDDWRNIKTIPDKTSPVMKAFQNNRSSVGNCIGNLHVLESSLNRSFGDDPLKLKLRKVSESEIELEKLFHENSLLYHCDNHEKLWETASPDEENDNKKNQIWSEERLQAFQSAVYRRSKGLYRQYYEACEYIIK